MKRFFGILGLILFGCLSGVQAQTTAVEPLAKAFSKAYAKKRLASLDRQRPYGSTIKFVISFSRIKDYEDAESEVKSFKTLAQAERWLIKRGIDSEMPSRQTEPLRGCKKGVCRYDVTGLLHNQLFLVSFTYGYRKGRPYIKTVYLTDGE